jgi:xanthine dehydrogenase accessory factor
VSRWSAREATALVLGSDVVPSAIAHALCTRGWSVVIIDEIDPPGPWRGMSFVNAWYFGAAELLNVAACFCASVKSIPAVLNRRNLIAATSWSWQGVAASLLPDVVVDARHAAHPAPLRTRTPEGLVTVGCGDAYVAGEHVDIAVAADHEAPATGHVLRASRAGRMRSPFRVGDRVEAGEPLGDVNGSALVAPIAGMLRGVSARGARVTAGQVVADIDPGGDAAACYGLAPYAARAAAAVVDALAAIGLLGDTRLSPRRHISDANWIQPARTSTP